MTDTVPPTPVVQTLLPGGTARGWSYWNKWLGCEREALYHEKAPPRVGGLSGNFATDVGTVMHKLQEMYYLADDGDLLDTRAIQWVDPIGFPKTYLDKVVKEADRCFQAYRRHHSNDELGKVLAAEAVYIAHAFLGLPLGFSIAPDLEVINPGYGKVIVDHKTFGRESQDDALALKHDLRFPAYILAYNQKHLDDPVNGVIVNVTYRKKVPEFKRFWIPRPDMLTTSRVRSTLERALRIRTAHVGLQIKHVPCRTNMCRTRFDKFCPFFEKCSRI